MKQENKDLLIKDLCARLPYGVKAEYKNEKFVIEYVSPMYEDVKLDNYETWTVGISDVKPYLFPLSSMTEEQKMELIMLRTYVSLNKNKEYLLFDWLNANHFDYRDLIPMELAIDATNLNIY